MTKKGKVSSKPELTYGGALAPLWDDLLSQEETATSFPPSPVNIDAVANRVIEDKALNGLTGEFEKFVAAARASRWLTDSEHRFVIGAELAERLADQMLKKCTAPDRYECTDDELLAYSAVVRIPEPDRAAVLGAMMLVPEPQYRAIDDLFEHDEAMVSSIFSIPISAAKLRVSYDLPVGGEAVR